MADFIKITVLKKLHMPDLIEKYAGQKVEICDRFQEGQVFVTTGKFVPEGFCLWAWNDIYKDTLLVRKDATCNSADKKCQVASCSDGFRPVIFLIEPWDRGTP